MSDRQDSIEQREKICAFDLGIRFFAKEAGMDEAQAEVFHKIAQWRAHGDFATISGFVKKAEEEGLNLDNIQNALISVLHHIEDAEHTSDPEYQSGSIDDAEAATVDAIKELPPQFSKEPLKDHYVEEATEAPHEEPHEAAAK